MPTICPTCGHTLLDIEEVDFDRLKKFSRPSSVRAILEDMRPEGHVILKSSELVARELMVRISPWLSHNNPRRPPGSFTLHKIGKRTILIRRVK